MTGVIIVISLYMILNIAGGIFAAREEKKRFFLFAIAGFSLFAAIFHLGVYLDREAVGKAITGALNGRSLYALYTDKMQDTLYSKALMPVTLIIAFTGISAGVIAYNVRKNSQTWYYAALWSLCTLFLQNFIIFYPAMIVLYAVIHLITPDFSPDCIYPVFLSVPLYFLIPDLLWSVYTLFSKRKGAKIILSAWTVISLLTLFLWSCAFIAGAICKNKVDSVAAMHKITPLENALQLPEKEKKLYAERHDFHQSHPLYSPPYNGIHNWYASDSKLSANEREFTLNFFDSKEAAGQIAREEQIALLFNSPDKNHIAAYQVLRSLARTYADRAALFELKGNSEKSMQELMRYIELENKLAAKSPFLIAEIVRFACRNTWLSAVSKHGSDDVKYLPLYLEMQKFVNSWQIALPDEAGFFINFTQKTDTPLKKFFVSPAENIIRYKGFFSALNAKNKLRELEKTEVFTDFTLTSSANSAVRQRSTIVLGKIAIALKCFRIEKGFYPEKLDMLVPGYLEKIPPAPVAFAKIRYESGNDGFSLEITNLSPAPKISSYKND